jgi:hypothetical protein
MTTKQNRLIYALLNKHGLTEQKADLAYSFSDNRTDKLSDLSAGETSSLIKYLNELKPEKDENDATRKYIISLWYRTENAHTPIEKKQALQKCLNWVKKNFKGELNSFDKGQLFKIKLAAEKVLKSRAASIRNKDENT